MHIEFEYDKVRFHLADVITGRVHFLLVRIRIKTMEVALLRREVTGTEGGGASSSTTSTDTLVKFEIMDGCPVKGEVIPLRLPLAGVELAPSATSVAGVLSVNYVLNLVLVDEEDRRYFKSCPVQLWRA